LTEERSRFANLSISEQEQNKISLRKAEHDIQQQVNVQNEENVEEILTEKNENKFVNDPEYLFYQEILKERARYQSELDDLRDSNKLALRRSEEQIQNQLLDLLVSNPQNLVSQTNNDPISQIVKEIVESGNKDTEQIVIDATKIIQMIQQNQSNVGDQEIDEYMLRQRIERELKYEFREMQIEHEKRMKSIYRRMIEDMYIDLLNS
jgi:hypothetical protein